jgi:hypothetical protein
MHVLGAAHHDPVTGSNNESYMCMQGILVQQPPVCSNQWRVRFPAHAVVFAKSTPALLLLLQA